MENLSDWFPLIFASSLGLFVGIVVDAIIKRRLLNTLYDVTTHAKSREDELTEENKTLSTQEETLESALSALHAEESRLKSEINQLETAGLSSTGNKPLVSQQIAQLEQDRSAISTQRAKLEQRLGEIEGDSAEIEIGIRFLKDEIARLSVQGEAMQEEIKNKRSDLARHAEKEVDLSPQFRALTKETAQLDWQVEVLREEKLESEVTRLTDKVQRLQDEVARLRGEES